MPNENASTPSTELKHKISPSCLNQCVKWTLSAKVTNQTESTAEFSGNSSFFHQLDASVLNILQNNNMNYTSMLARLNESSSSSLSNTSPNLLEIMKMKLPIDNSAFNFMIIDANLGIKENLNNIFFLEFDMNNEEGNKIRNINDDIVEKEINFTLNGTLHDVKLFKSDLVFSVEYRKFIKSIQFRLQNYKNQTLNKKKYNSKHNKKNNTNNMNNNKKDLTFYAKILSNINIGIEFMRNSIDEYEFFHTNFNSIVNSNIKINKIYLEVCIPKIFIEGKNINLNKMKISTESSSTTSQSNTTTQTPSSPSNTPYQNDFDRMLYKQHNSPSLSLRSNFTLNGRYHFHNNNNPGSFYNSPPITIKPPQNLNPPHLIYSPLSPMVQGAFYPPPFPGFISSTPTNQRKFSENVYDKIKENPLSKMKHQIPQVYTNSQTPVIMRMNNEDFIAGIPVQPFISPRGVPHRMQHGYMPMGNPMVGTIHKRIIDWESKNDTEGKKGDEKGNRYKNEFMNTYNGRSNLDLFVNAITPAIGVDNKDYTIKEFFKGFTKSSLFGIKITYYMIKELKNIIYSCTLSSMEIIITKKNIVDIISSYLISINKITKDQISNNEYIFINDLSQNLKVRISSSDVMISYYENKPFHFRLNLIRTLSNLLNAIPPLGGIDISDIADESYISILYTPLKINKNITSFIVYYKFKSSSPTMNAKYKKIDFIGLLPIKFDSKFFFLKIVMNNFLMTNDMMILNTYISNVLESIIKPSIQTSYDYEIYLKTNSELFILCHNINK